MSFVLPRNARELRFTGQVRAIAPAPRPVIVRRAEGRRVERGESFSMAPTPYVGARPQPSLGRAPMASYDDDSPTLALDPNPMAAVIAAHRPVARVPGPSPWVQKPAARRPPPPPPSSALAAAAVAQDESPKIIRRETREEGPLPWAFWVMTAILLGLMSYRFVPEIFAGF